MGQYYKPYLRDAAGVESTFCSQNAIYMTVHGLGGTDEIGKRSWDFNDPESWGSCFSGLKLMEHSWLDNDFINGVMECIEDNPCIVAWVGDYANEDGDFDGRYTRGVYDKVWGARELPELPFQKVPETHRDGFIVNHDKWLYIDLAEYAAHASTSDGWCVHPLPLLTAIGNGRGSGDYWNGHLNSDMVGAWAMNVIEYTHGRPSGCQEVDYRQYRFMEDD